MRERKEKLDEEEMAGRGRKETPRGREGRDSRVRRRQKKKERGNGKRMRARRVGEETDEEGIEENGKKEVKRGNIWKEKNESQIKKM